MEVFEIIKQSDDFKYFANAKNMPHSILLFSKDEQYSLELAKLLAIQILDGKVDSESEVFKKVMLFSHPDVKYYPSKNQLLVADSEEIVSESFVKPIFSNSKVFIIKNIDNSMESAQNKLLKTLEEPSKDAYLILTCFNPALVLPTIKSRCAKRDLAKLSDKQIESVLGNENPLAIKLADGGLGKAISLSQKPDLDEIFALALDIMTKMKSSKEVLSYSKRMQKFPKDFPLIVECMSLILEDLLKLKTGGKIRLEMFGEELKKASEGYSIKALTKINGKINDEQKEVFYNVNQLIAMENLLLNILEVKYICK